MVVKDRTRLIDPLFLPIFLKDSLMKKIIFMSIAVLCFISTSAYSSQTAKLETVESSPLDSMPKRLMDESFVIETSDDDAMDSLNRVAGMPDTGFASKESTYKSVRHGRSGPFATHEDAYDVS